MSAAPTTGSTPGGSPHPPSGRVTRLAPSPTGALHLGNARTFLINWAIARQRGWRIILRIEDLDGPRVKEGADRQAIDILAWLGLGWDEGPAYQRRDLAPYREAIGTLADLGLTYSCGCTRREIESAQTAPHGDEHELRYPGTCRRRAVAPGDEPTAVRLIVPDEALAFDDAFAGSFTVNVQQQVGDFVIATKSDLPAYQLAVVVDDHRQGVTDVIRGDDLLGSTGRQLWLYRLLGLSSAPAYTHLPLVVGPDGRRLAKRHGDTRIDRYRGLGAGPERIIGLLAAWSGVLGRPEPMSADAFATVFDLDRLPRDPITFTEEDHAWLLAD